MSVSEGFPVSGSRPQVNNNPLDLIWGDESERFGATHGDRPGHIYKGYSGFAVFPTLPMGWRAAQRWLSIPAKFGQIKPKDNRPLGPSGYLMAGYLGATFEQVIYRFAPPEDNNNTEAYIVGTMERVPGLTRQTIVTPEWLQTPEVIEVPA